MAASLYKAQFALNLCENHDKKELHAYCKTCKEKICSSCIKEDHISHDWETITDILREKKRTLPEECKEIRSKQLPGLKKELSRFDRKIEDENTRFEQNKSALNSSRQSYIKEINRLFDEKIDECRQSSEEAKQMYNDKREVLKKKVEFLDMITKSLDKDIDTLPDHDILDMEKEMRDELEKALTYSADKYTCTTVFAPGKMDVQNLENMIGEIHNVSVEEMYYIDGFFKYISSINPVCETNAWVKVDKDNYAKLINRAGDILRTMKNPCSKFIITDSGEFVLTSKVTRSISVLTGNEDTIRTIDTDQLLPTFISKTQNDDILVTLVDDGDYFTPVTTSRRIVQRMTLTGKVIHTYEFREDGQTRLFTSLMRTTENKNTDVCVVNWLNGNKGELVVLHKDGRMKFTYRGDEQKTGKFMPSDVECDSKCRILFTENYSKSIHMLSAEGMYLCTLCQYKNLRPYVLSVFGDYLWCGFKEKQIKVLKYNN